MSLTISLFISHYYLGYLGFYYGHKCCFLFAARKKKRIQVTLLSSIDCGSILYMHASPSPLKKLDSVFHAALQFVSDSGLRRHHFSLYERVGLSSFYNRRIKH